MSLEAAASNLSSAQLGSEISYAVQRKVLNAARDQGDAAVALLENAARIGKSGNTDSLAAAATGKGARLDVYG